MNTYNSIKKKRPSSASSSSSTMSKVNATMKLSTDPQSVAARERRHRISDRFKILQSLVPGGTKMDIVSLLEEAIHYVKFLKTQIWLHHNMIVLNSADHDRTVCLAPPDHIAAHGSGALYGVPQVAQPQADSYFQTHETTSLGCSEYWKY